MPIAVKKRSDQFEMKFLFGYRLFCWKFYKKKIYIYIYKFKLIFISEFTVYLFALFMDNKKKKKKKEGGRRIQTNTKHFKS